MKRPVYDNDHPATDLLEKHFPNRWAPEKDDPDVTEVTGNGYKDKRARAQKDAGSWQANNANGFTVAGRNDKETSWVRYRHVLRDTDGKPQLINDFMSYNTGDSSGAPSGGNRWVGDLLLECEVKVAAAEGELVFELSKGVDRFQARWALQTGLCTLLRNGKELASKTTRMSKPGTYQVGFANFDRRLTVWVNRGLVFGDGVDYKAPEGRDAEGTKHILHGPSAKNDLEPASIGSTGGAALAVHKLKLWRDSYYLSYSANSEDSVSTDIFLDPSRWQQEYTLEAMTMYVQPGHYLCLGDNSPASSDSRIWKKENESQTESGGLVPERLMLGRALVIYYPFYFPYPPFSSDENRVRIIE
jgi:signal peptidase I